MEYSVQKILNYLYDPATQSLKFSGSALPISQDIPIERSTQEIINLVFDEANLQIRTT
ncbi:MAG: hypothetical protein ACOYWZ_11065 [Bacillota bacterium]